MVIKEPVREQNVVIADLPVYEYSNLLVLPEFVLLKDTRKNKSKIRYTEQILTFDIETTTINKDLNIMYIWMVCFDGEFCLYGRTWDQFLDFLNRIKSSTYFTIPIYVHNLSYEFQYLRGIIDFKSEDVFCMQSRKVAKCTTDNIEFRCSYYLSNMSLFNWGKNLKVKHLKRSGEDFNYQKLRYPNTELTEKEMAYCIYDVVTLYECIMKVFEIDNDNIYTVPLTSTGYVRRDVKKELYARKKFISEIFPDLDILKQLQLAFRGGDTHANRFYAGMILENVYSFDRQSSYPDNLVNDIFPITPFKKQIETIYMLKKLLKNNRLALLFTIELEDVRLKDESWGFPYIPIAKSRDLKNYVNDNGRVLECKHLEITVTDIDFRIIEKEYDFKIIAVTGLYSSKYGKLPYGLKNVILKYYKLKTELKGVEGQEVYYMKSKNKLNACYGMMVQNPIKDTILYRDFDFELDDSISDLEKMLRYYKTSVLSYAWGVWTTAWSRYRLHEALYIAGEDAVYCDTDSVKAMTFLDFDRFNTERIAKCNENNGYAIDKKGNTQYLGIFDYEGKYDRFVTLGAKKYAYEKDGELYITIAGVSKTKGAKELKEAGGLKAFRPGMLFTVGQEDWRYNDSNTSVLNLNGMDVIVTPNISVVPSTYKLSIGNDYSSLLRTVIFLQSYRKIGDDLLTR